MADNEVKHWADQIVDNIVKVFGKKKTYVCATGISPSGTIHFGNFRETITTDIVYRALKLQGKKAKLIFFWDDYDRLRKIPKNVKSDMNHEIGKPYSMAKDPFGCHQSYADHFEKEYEKELHRVDIDPIKIYQHKRFNEGFYAEDIKFVLKNKNPIKGILDNHRKDPLPSDWWPVIIYCDKCHKDHTKIISYDDKYDLEYDCKCGNKAHADLKKTGNVKVPWRIDWPLRWNKEKTDFEPSGKEHSTPGGSRTTGDEIIKIIWNRDPPIHRMYDFIILKGQGGKMSGSLGNVISLSQVLEIYEPSIVRFLFAGTRPNTEFFVSFDLDVLKVYEDFDKCERIYFNKKEAKNDKEHINKKRIYELSALEIPKKQPIQPGMRHLSNYLQVYENDYKEIRKFFEKDIKTNFDEARLKLRCELCWNWLQKFAPDSLKFKIQKEIRIKPKGKAKEALLILKERIRAKNFTDETLHKEFYEIIKQTEVQPKDFFREAYQVLIGKDRGPKLAGFILAIGKKRVLDLLEKI